MKEFPIQGCFKFDGKNQNDLITYLKKNRTSNDIISRYDIFVAWNSKFYWFCQSSSKTEYKWEELSKFVTKTVSMEEKHEDYTGRTIKALINSPQCTGVKLGEEIKILKVTGSNNYLLDKTAKGIPGMWITKPLNLEQWELLPEISPPSIPEYVECISDDFSSIHLGGIYKLNPSSTNHRYSLKNVNIETYSSSFFKPSTKEAYDAQFVATSSILPKKWCLKITSSNQEVLNKWRKRQPNFFEQSIGFTGWLISDANDGTYTHWDNNVPVGYTEITLQQFYDNVHPIDVYDIIKKESSVYVHDSYETVKTKPLIENVHSVSVKLSTKKINNKFKF